MITALPAGRMRRPSKRSATMGWRVAYRENFGFPDSLRSQEMASTTLFGPNRNPIKSAIWGFIVLTSGKKLNDEQ